MKIQLIIITLLLASFVSRAQVFDYETRSVLLEEEQHHNLNRQKILDNHISSFKIYLYKTATEAKDDRGRLDYEVIYDAQGNISEEKQYNKRGKLKYDFIYKWDNKERMIELKTLKGTSKLMYSDEQYVYDPSGNVSDYRFFYKHPDNMTAHMISTYNDQQNMTETRTLTKNDKKKYSRDVYTYYPDGSKKQTIEYNKKGKIWHIWNYDCNPVGDLVKKNMKDTSKICIRYETDKDGNNIKIKEENVKQGAIVRVITKYDVKDSPLEVIKYDIKGRIREHSKSMWNQNEKLTERILYKNKSNEIKERSEFHYDDTTGFLTEFIIYKKALTPDEIMKYNYARTQ